MHHSNKKVKIYIIYSKTKEGRMYDINYLKMNQVRKAITKGPLIASMHVIHDQLVLGNIVDR
ncbi:hypothetical protein Hanom_Chr06g00529771 [Helianthus anomalus]